MKKAYKAIVYTVIVSLLLIVVSPITNAASFEDLPFGLGAEYVDAINYVSDNHIMVGTSSGCFSPDLYVTRAMAVTVLYVMSGDNETYTNPFSDVLPGRYYYNAVGWAYENGITNGTSPSSFSPLQIIDKQHLIIMLYRFAEYLELERILDEDITEASDYLNVYSYAIDALRWAYSYGILTRESPTEAIIPSASIARKDLALMVSRFRTHAEGINLNRDSFSFANSYSAFVSSGSNYLVSENDWNTFVSIVDMYGSYKDESYYLTRPWAGSCYGMSIATALDYIGKIDLNGNYCNGVTSIHDIPSLNMVSDTRHQTTTAYQHPEIIISEVESKINLYQDSWFIRPIYNWSHYINTDTGLRELVSGQQHGGIGVFSYTWVKTNNKNAGHAVNVFGKPQIITNGYRIMVYDNRSPSSLCYIEIDTSGSAWSGKMVKASGGYEVFKSCKYESNFDVYNLLDIDGSFNDSPNEAIFGDYCLLQICTTDDFVIENAETETLTCINGQVSGDMETYRQDFLPSGEDYPVEYHFVVPISDSFTCTVGTGNTIESFYLAASTGTDGIIAEDYPDTTIHQVNISNISVAPSATIVP